jgi:hypothetical protein
MTSQKYKCKHLNSKSCYNIKRPVNIMKKDCPIIKNKMLTHTYCNDEGIVNIEWTQYIIFKRILDEHFTKI